MHVSGSNFIFQLANLRMYRPVWGNWPQHAYLLDAARQLPCAGLDQGYKLAVIAVDDFEAGSLMGIQKE
jgi:hypothetical protein